MKRFGMILLLGLVLVAGVPGSVSAQEEDLEERLLELFDDLELRLDAALQDLEARAGSAIDDLQQQIDSHHNVSPATCAEVAYSGRVWGAPAEGLDFRKRTNSTLHFVGCNGNGCGASTFFCDEDRANGTLTFGTTDRGNALRAQVDPVNVGGDVINQDPNLCADPVNPNWIANVASGEDVADNLCRALGYAEGTSFSGISTQTCSSIQPADLNDLGLHWRLDPPVVVTINPVQSVMCTGGN